MCRTIEPFIYVLLCLSMFMSCSTDSNPAMTKLNDLLNNATLEPSAENLKLYFDEATSFVSDNKEDSNVILPVLEQASNFAVEKKQYSKSTALYLWHIR